MIRKRRYGTQNLIRRLLLFGALSLSVSMFGGSVASALSGSDFHAGNILSDYVFTNSYSMTAQNIQTFLNTKMPSCDTNGTVSKSYYYNSSTGRINNSADTWVTTSRATYGQRYDNWYGTTIAAAPYVCLRDYVENPTSHVNNLQNPGASIAGGQTAAQIIYNAAQTYHVNPEVLIVTLQKEQGLITDDWPWTNEYKTAMGFACPDTAPCDSQYYGFANQVSNAAARFHDYMTNPNSYNYVVGNNNILYSPAAGCGAGPVNIQYQGTAALYDYTPYQPNAAALANVSDTSAGGIGDGCSSYGIRNFWWYFNQWFAVLPELVDRYTVLANAGISLGSPTDDGFCVNAAHDACWQGFQNGYIVYSKSTGAWESYGAIRTRWAQLGYQSGEMGFPNGPIYCTLANSGCYQQYQNGFIVGSPGTGWWESMGSIRARWAALNFQDGKMGYPTGGINPAVNGGYYQQYQNGFIVGNNSAGYWESMNGPVRDRWGTVGFQDGRLGYPTNAPDCTTQPNSGCRQNFQGGSIFWTSGTGAWQVWGAIGGRYAQLGTDSSSLGYPISAEVCGTIRNNGCFQQYQNGYIVGSPTAGWWESMGPIRDRWAALSFQDSRLGYPTSALDCTQPNSGCKQAFQGGSIFWTSGTGAWQTWGAIGGRYAQLGTDTSNLGYPVNAEACGTIKDGGCFQQYQNGYIVGSPTAGWWESLGGIRTRWGQLGYENGEMGYPTGSQACTLRSSGCFQVYQGGYIVGTPTTGYWESFGAIRTKWASLGYQDGTAGYPTGAVVCASGTCSQTYEHGTIYTNQSTTWYVPS